MTTTLPHPPKQRRPDSGPTAKPSTKPGVKPATKPGAKPGTKPAARPGVKPGTRPTARTSRTGPAPKAPRTPFVLLIVGLLGGALVSLLLLNTVLAEDAFKLNDLQRTNTQLAQQEQELKVDVKKAESPAELARHARALGMRPGPMTPEFANAQHPAGTSKYAGKTAGKHATSRRHPATTRRHTSSTSSTHRTTHSRSAPARSDSGNSDPGDSAFAGNGR